MDLATRYIDGKMNSKKYLNLITEQMNKHVQRITKAIST